MRTRLAAVAAAAALATALGACGGGGDGGGDGGNERPAATEITKREGDAQLLRSAADTYRREVRGSLAAVRSGLTQGDYDDDLNDDVYALRGAIYRFDQALRRIEFEPSAEGRANEILSGNSAAIAQLDPIIEAKRWPDDTKERVGRVLDGVDATLEQVDALLARL